VIDLAFKKKSFIFFLQEAIRSNARGCRRTCECRMYLFICSSLATPFDVCDASRGRTRILQMCNRGDVLYYKFAIDTASHTFLAHLPTLAHPPAAGRRNVSHYTHSLLRPFLPLTLVMRHSDARVASRRVASLARAPFNP
jgi:hypothetical protein